MKHFDYTEFDQESGIVCMRNAYSRTAIYSIDLNVCILECGKKARALDGSVFTILPVSQLKSIYKVIFDNCSGAQIEQIYEYLEAVGEESKAFTVYDKIFTKDILRRMKV